MMFLSGKHKPLPEKLSKAAADANASIAKGVGTLDKAVRKTAGEVKTGAAKTAVTVKKETKKASASLGKAAAKDREKSEKDGEEGHRIRG